VPATLIKALSQQKKLTRRRMGFKRSGPGRCGGFQEKVQAEGHQVDVNFITIHSSEHPSRCHNKRSEGCISNSNAGEFHLELVEASKKRLKQRDIGSLKTETSLA